MKHSSYEFGSLLFSIRISISGVIELNFCNVNHVLVVTVEFEQKTNLC